jgi:ADP-heptose:LPS heptosyltransferase
VARIAVLPANGLGDYVFCTPALGALRAAYPAAEITLLTRPWHAAFLAGRGTRRAGRAGARTRGGGRWSNPFVRRLGAALTAGCRVHDAAALDRWVGYVDFQPEIVRYLEVAALVGARSVTVEPAIAVTHADRLEAQGHTEGGPFAVLHPGASVARRRWRPERFARVGDALAEEGLRVVVTGTAPERESVAAVRETMRAPSEGACGTLSVGGLAALLSAATLVVSNDSGPLHLADAVGARTVGIFWSAT